MGQCAVHVLLFWEDRSHQNRLVHASEHTPMGVPLPTVQLWTLIGVEVRPGACYVASRVLVVTQIRGAVRRGSWDTAKVTSFWSRA